jgi:hypothetical protein
MSLRLHSSWTHEKQARDQDKQSARGVLWEPANLRPFIPKDFNGNQVDNGKHSQ